MVTVAGVCGEYDQASRAGQWETQLTFIFKVSFEVMDFILHSKCVRQLLARYYAW